MAIGSASSTLPQMAVYACGGSPLIIALYAASRTAEALNSMPITRVDDPNVAAALAISSPMAPPPQQRSSTREGKRR
eukprot:CAMPEP_0174745720 /NCGR_PEP_ID=MMETSP1094-20130205/87435_1 /TAXON_ID=156173 /ORGANISM="Chrysochromulina brevifilum, Strain UTEX LB 985" /LENGTH=76 /DNA_ID=CAMNT_0015950309 /DNA_START=704 /DNA_END=930 /DNA_ORIENTATION=-